MEKQMEDGGPIGWMREAVERWLAGARSVEQLVGWLEGRGLPPVGHDEEPYLWILRGIPLADARARAERAFAQRVAEVLADFPSAHTSVEPPEQGLYNLLMLAAGLACRAELAEPLYTLYQRGSISGDWLGLDLRHALRIALGDNQIDARLFPEWESMLEANGAALLPGRPRDGFEGILKMPESRDTLGKPATGALGRALGVMAGQFERDDERRPRFRALITRIYFRYFLIEDPYQRAIPHPYDRELIYQAHKHHWPKWAADCLPSLYVVIGGDETNTRMLVSRYYLPKTSHFPYRIESELCDGQILEVTMGKSSASVVEMLVKLAEPVLRNNPFPSDRSTVAALAHVAADEAEHTYNEAIRNYATLVNECATQELFPNRR